MGSFLDKPKTDKHNETGSGNGLRFALSSMQGWRVEMEDAHSALVSLPGNLKDWSFFAVYDGHAGSRVSAYCADQLIRSITANEALCSLSESEIKELTGKEDIVKCAIRQGFLNLDETMRKLPEVQNGEDKSGSTVVCVLISPTHIYFANCGDSRVVLSRNKQLAFSTQDHKPINPLEKERIQNAGGSVMIQRVNGSLAVSRALGDFEYKNVSSKGQCEQLVSPEPEVFVEERANDDEFLVLACDGVWDVMSNEELCDFVRNRMETTSDLDYICNLVIDTCLHKGSRDNMSVVIVAFDGAPAVSKEAVDKETALDALLESRVKEILSRPRPPAANLLAYVIHTLATEETIPNLPPGGGLMSKRALIEKLVEKYGQVTNDTRFSPQHSAMAVE